jgi:hypothetical protein
VAITSSSAKRQAIQYPLLAHIIGHFDQGRTRLLKSNSSHAA